MTDEPQAQAELALLVAAAVEGDQGAWDEIVDRFTPLLVRILLRYHLTRAELEDVAQTVWLRLVERLEDLREPRALPGWIVTTARREALHAAARADRTRPQDPQDPVWASRLVSYDDPAAGLEHDERQAAVLEGFALLSPRQRLLLEVLSEDPPPPYSEVSRRTGMPVGSIGPTRARALDIIRGCPAVQALMSVGSADVRGEPMTGGLCR